MNDGVQSSFTLLGANNTNYNVTVNTSLMEDYTAGLPVDAKHRPVAVRDKSGNAIVFSVGTDGRFYAIYFDPSTSQGWNQLEISKIFETPGKEATVSAYTAAQHHDGTFQIAFAVNIAGSVSATLYLSQKFSNEVSKLALDLVSVSNYITRPDNIGGAKIKQLMLGHDDASNIFIALASQADKEVYKHYLINVDASVQTNTWSEYPLPHNIDEMLSVVIGNHYEPGTFRLYRVGTSRVLEFVTVYPDEFGKFVHVPFNTPPNANVIAVTKGTTTNDDLYVGGSGLFYFDGATKSKDANMITDNSKTPNIREVILSQDNANLSAWVMTEKEELLYLTRKVSSTAWSNPIALFGDAAQVTPLRNQNEQANEVYVVTTDNHLFHISQDPASTVWRRQPVVIHSTGHGSSFQCYATSIRIQAPKAGSLAFKVKVLPSAWGYYLINGKTHLINSKNGIEVELDASNRITILTKVTDLDSPKYTISSSAFGANSFTVDPSNFVYSKLSSLDENGLKNATYAQGSKKGQKVLQGKYAEDSNVKVSHQVLQNMSHLSYITTPSGSGSPEDLKKSGVVLNQDTTKKLDTTNLKPGYAWGFVTNDKGEVSFFDDRNAIAQIIKYVAPPLYFIGDLIEHFVHNLQKHPKSFWIHFTPEKLLTLVIDFGEAVVQTVIDTVNGLIKALNWVLEKLFGINLDEILQWLGNLFDWKAIKRTQVQIKKFVNNILQVSEDAMDHVKSKVADGSHFLEEQINQLQKNLPPEMRDATVGNYVTKPAKQTSEKHSSTLDSHSTNWTSYQIEHGITLAKDTVEDITNSQIMLDIASLFAEVADTVKDLFKDIGAIFTNDNATVGQLFEKLGIDLLKHLLRIVTKAVLLLLDLVKGAFSTIKSVINKRINIPLITWLYEKYVGSEMTFLDLTALLIAIPTSVICKLLGKEPFAHEPASTLDFRSMLTSAGYLSPTPAPHKPVTPHAVNRTLMESPALTAASSEPSESQKEYGFAGGIIYSLVGVCYGILQIMTFRSADRMGGLGKLIPALGLIRFACSFPIGGSGCEIALWAEGIIGVVVDSFATVLIPSKDVNFEDIYGKAIANTKDVANLIKCIEAIGRLIIIIPLSTN